jgi:Holliday junction DNA helicase RuvA
MIGRLRGEFVAAGADAVTVDVAGVGYEIAVTGRTFAELPGIGSEIVLHTHLHVREDQLALFGFTTADDRDLFRLLMGVSGVGPKVGLAILATMTADDLRRVVATDDAAALTAVPGIGKRSAQKLLLELRPKLDVPDGDLQASGPLGEVRTALEGLGYESDEISSVLRDLPPDLPVEALLKRSLQALGKRCERCGMWVS